jgi:hypothetical protein
MRVATFSLFAVLTVQQAAAQVREFVYIRQYIKLTGNSLRIGQSRRRSLVRTTSIIHAKINRAQAGPLTICQPAASARTVPFRSMASHALVALESVMPWERDQPNTAAKPSPDLCRQAGAPASRVALPSSFPRQPIRFL